MGCVESTEEHSYETTTSPSHSHPPLSAQQATTSSSNPASSPSAAAAQQQRSSMTRSSISRAHHQDDGGAGFAAHPEGEEMRSSTSRSGVTTTQGWRERNNNAEQQPHTSLGIGFPSMEPQPHHQQQQQPSSSSATVLGTATSLSQEGRVSSSLSSLRRYASRQRPLPATHDVNPLVPGGMSSPSIASSSLPPSSIKVGGSTGDGGGGGGGVLEVVQVAAAGGSSGESVLNMSPTTGNLIAHAPHALPRGSSFAVGSGGSGVVSFSGAHSFLDEQQQQQQSLQSQHHPSPPFSQNPTTSRPSQQQQQPQSQDSSSSSRHRGGVSQPSQPHHYYHPQQQQALGNSYTTIISHSNVSMSQLRDSGGGGGSARNAAPTAGLQWLQSSSEHAPPQSSDGTSSGSGGHHHHHHATSSPIGAGRRSSLPLPLPVSGFDSADPIHPQPQRFVHERDATAITAAAGSRLLSDPPTPTLPFGDSSSPSAPAVSSGGRHLHVIGMTGGAVTPTGAEGGGAAAGMMEEDSSGTALQTSSSVDEQRPLNSSSCSTVGHSTTATMQGGHAPAQSARTKSPSPLSPRYISGNGQPSQQQQQQPFALGSLGLPQRPSPRQGMNPSQRGGLALGAYPSSSNSAIAASSQQQPHGENSSATLTTADSGIGSNPQHQPQHQLHSSTSPFPPGITGNSFSAFVPPGSGAGGIGMGVGAGVAAGGSGRRPSWISNISSVSFEVPSSSLFPNDAGSSSGGSGVPPPHGGAPPSSRGGMMSSSSLAGGALVPNSSHHNYAPGTTGGGGGSSSMLPGGGGAREGVSSSTHHLLVGSSFDVEGETPISFYTTSMEVLNEDEQNSRSPRTTGTTSSQQQQHQQQQPSPALSAVAAPGPGDGGSSSGPPLPAVTTSTATTTTSSTSGGAGAVVVELLEQSPKFPTSIRSGGDFDDPSGAENRLPPPPPASTHPPRLLREDGGGRAPTTAPPPILSSPHIATSFTMDEGEDIPIQSQGLLPHGHGPGAAVAPASVGGREDEEAEVEGVASSFDGFRANPTALEQHQQEAWSKRSAELLQRLTSVERIASFSGRAPPPPQSPQQAESLLHSSVVGGHDHHHPAPPRPPLVGSPQGRQHLACDSSSISHGRVEDETPQQPAAPTTTVVVVTLESPNMGSVAEYPATPQPLTGPSIHSHQHHHPRPQHQLHSSSPSPASSPRPARSVSPAATNFLLHGMPDMLMVETIVTSCASSVSGQSPRNEAGLEVPSTPTPTTGHQQLETPPSLQARRPPFAPPAAAALAVSQPTSASLENTIVSGGGVGPHDALSDEFATPHPTAIVLISPAERGGSAYTILHHGGAAANGSSSVVPMTSDPLHVGDADASDADMAALGSGLPPTDTAVPHSRRLGTQQGSSVSLGGTVNSLVPNTSTASFDWAAYAALQGGSSSVSTSMQAHHAHHAALNHHLHHGHSFQFHSHQVVSHSIASTNSFLGPGGTPHQQQQQQQQQQARIRRSSSSTGTTTTSSSSRRGASGSAASLPVAAPHEVSPALRIALQIPSHASPMQWQQTQHDAGVTLPLSFNLQESLDATSMEAALLRRHLSSTTSTPMNHPNLFPSSGPGGHQMASGGGGGGAATSSTASNLSISSAVPSLNQNTPIGPSHRRWMQQHPHTFMMGHSTVAPLFSSPPSTSAGAAASATEGGAEVAVGGGLFLGPTGGGGGRPLNSRASADSSSSAGLNEDSVEMSTAAIGLLNRVASHESSTASIGALGPQRFGVPDLALPDTISLVAPDEEDDRASNSGRFQLRGGGAAPTSAVAMGNLNGGGGFVVPAVYSYQHQHHHPHLPHAPTSPSAAQQDQQLQHQRPPPPPQSANPSQEHLHSGVIPMLVMQQPSQLSGPFDADEGATSSRHGGDLHNLMTSLVLDPSSPQHQHTMAYLAASGAALTGSGTMEGALNHHHYHQQPSPHPNHNAGGVVLTSHTPLAQSQTSSQAPLSGFSQVPPNSLRLGAAAALWSSVNSGANITHTATSPYYFPPTGTAVPTPTRQAQQQLLLNPHQGHTVVPSALTGAGRGGGDSNSESSSTLSSRRTTSTLSGGGGTTVAGASLTTSGMMMLMMPPAPPPLLTSTSFVVEAAAAGAGAPHPSNVGEMSRVPPATQQQQQQQRSVALSLEDNTESQRRVSSHIAPPPPLAPPGGSGTQPLPHPSINDPRRSSGSSGRHHPQQQQQPVPAHSVNEGDQHHHTSWLQQMEDDDDVSDQP